MLFTSVAIGQRNYFGFGFTTLNWNPLYFVDVFVQSIAKLVAFHYYNFSFFGRVSVRDVGPV